MLLSRRNFVIFLIFIAFIIDYSEEKDDEEEEYDETYSDEENNEEEEHNEEEKNNGEEKNSPEQEYYIENCELKPMKMYPADCYEAVVMNEGKAGIYKIHIPLFIKEPFHVFCRYDESGNIWTVFQRRVDNNVLFDRDWHDYKHGFGHVDGNFWLGLERLYAITTNIKQDLLIEMVDMFDNYFEAYYDLFAIGDESEQYGLKVLGKYTGDAGDSLRNHTGQMFSTKDRDNDQLFTHNCALEGDSGWWFSHCFDSNLNGKYYAPYGEYGYSYDPDGCGYFPINWHGINGQWGCLKKATMMVRSQEKPMVSPVLKKTTTVDPFDASYDWEDYL